MTAPDTDPTTATSTSTSTSTGGHQTGRRSLGANYRKVFTATVISNLGDGVSAVGYPWLASAVTRNPMLIAATGIVQRLPWLVFTLPAGVITDRVDRRRLIVTMDVIRGLITVAVSVAVLGWGGHLPKPDQLTSVTGTRVGLYLVLTLAALLLGCAEVLRDNSAQTILPSVVAQGDLERANGRMWSAEMAANTFVGPPLGSLLISAAFFLPFAFDAVSFFAAAGLVSLLVGQFRAHHGGDDAPLRLPWRTELADGFRWLWHHRLLRTLALTLGPMNMIGSLSTATLVLYAQEVLHTTPLEFAIMGVGGAVGGIVGGITTPRITRRFGTGPTLWLTLIAGVIGPLVIGLVPWWPIVLIMFAVEMTVGMAWNVITVSLRQEIIPPHLLGRVNSVYRFFGWGMMPIGMAIGGATVAVVGWHWSRDTALTAPWFVGAVLAALLAVWAIPQLTTQAIETARAAATGTTAPTGGPTDSPATPGV